MKKLLVMGAVVAGLLVGCEAEEAVKEVKEPVKAEESVKAAETKKVDETKYLKNMSASMKNVADSLGSISEESAKFSENPALMMDQGWIVDMAMAITLLDSSIIQVRDIEEPKGKELKKAHTLVLKAMDHYQYVVDNYPSAIDNMDADAIRKCTENLSTATGYIQEATGIITDYQDNM